MCFQCSLSLSHKLSFLCVDFCRFVDSHCLWKGFLVACFDFGRKRKKKEERTKKKKTVHSFLGAHIFLKLDKKKKLNIGYRKLAVPFIFWIS